MFKFLLAKDNTKEPTAEIVKCHECGHLIEKCDGQEVIKEVYGLVGNYMPRWDVIEENLIFCKLHKKPYDKIGIDGKFFKRNPEYSEVDEKGNALSQDKKGKLIK